MIRTFLAALLLVAFSTSAAHALFGRTQPVYNVQNMTVYTGTGKPATLDQVQSAITQGATEKGWQVRNEGPGHIVAQIFVRSHMAEVDIKFDAKHYSITYRNSANLLYDGASIHRNYNKWVKFMSDRINLALKRF